ncbi:MAG: DNA/RNA nuclease SfsA [Myxococcota bacterium]|nr:DNA/RNA nuclease SfsA [Myxococcota bacterium]
MSDPTGPLVLPELHRGTLIRRYKRFLADVRLDDGREVTAHCPNPGRMTSCQEPGWEVWLSHHPDPKRKLKWSWELSRDPAGTLILVNTQRPNAVLAQALRAGQVPKLAHYQQLQTEVRYGQERSRIDVLLSEPGLCYVELKSVTLLTEPGQAAFPDAVSARGAKHLRELSQMVAEGHRALLFFLVSRGDAQRVRPAREIDPKYGQALDEALSSGVEILAHRLQISDPAQGQVHLSIGEELLFSPKP